MTGLDRRSAGLAPLCALLAAACSEPGPNPAGVVVDTLSGGTVVVETVGEGEWGARASLAETLRIGSLNGGPDEFGSVHALAFDALDRIWVLDSQSRDIRVFDQRGAHVRTIGGEGEGPGELRRPAGMWNGPAGRMWIADTGNQRYTAFDTAGTVVASHTRTVLGRLIPTGLRPASDGSFLDAGAGMWDSLSVPTVFRLDARMEKTDSLTITPPQVDTEGRYFDVPDAAFPIPIPWKGDYVWAPGTRGRVWLAHSRRYRLDRLSLRGDTLLRIVRAADPVDVDPRERTQVLARLDSVTGRRLSAQADRVPSTKPLFRELIESDDGRLWVVRETEYGWVGTRFDVFAPDGRFLGVATTPVRLLPPFRVVGDRLLATTRDELDVPYIVVMRLERGG